MVCVVNPMGMRGLEGLIGFTVDEKQFNESLQSRQRPAKLGNYNNRSTDQSLIDSLIHCFIHLLIHSLIHSLTHSLIH